MLIIFQHPGATDRAVVDSVTYHYSYDVDLVRAIDQVQTRMCLRDDGEGYAACVVNDKAYASSIVAKIDYTDDVLADYPELFL